MKNYIVTFGKTITKGRNQLPYYQINIRSTMNIIYGDLEGSLYYSMKSLANNRFVQFSTKSIVYYIAKLPTL